MNILKTDKLSISKSYKVRLIACETNLKSTEIGVRLISLRESIKILSNRIKKLCLHRQKSKTINK